MRKRFESEGERETDCDWLKKTSSRRTIECGHGIKKNRKRKLVGVEPRRGNDKLKITALILAELSEGVPHRPQKIIPSLCLPLSLSFHDSLFLFVYLLPVDSFFILCFYLFNDYEWEVVMNKLRIKRTYRWFLCSSLFLTVWLQRGGMVGRELKAI